MIDNDGYRQNVGIVICNFEQQVLWAKRYGQHFWQFPQGGIKFGETAEEAMYRELFEELGLNCSNVCILASTHNWLRYKLPKQLVRWDTNPICIGQKQKWFLLQIMCPDMEIKMQCGIIPEFDDWRWVSFWYPIRQVVSFKRDVYRRVMKEFSNIIMLHRKNKTPFLSLSYRRKRIHF
ncbi:RNA pyrophosphohydrolase [Candidatus Curculioniphilus buchneri]|uniref:RNA pyrophosphohydrolase n=1 Tax=Candidatus Curculioniphilus buchneri TaxID=690594 RepID=UPI00376F323E